MVAVVASRPRGLGVLVLRSGPGPDAVVRIAFFQDLSIGVARGPRVPVVPRLRSRRPRRDRRAWTSMSQVVQFDTGGDPGDGEHVRPAGGPGPHVRPRRAGAVLGGAVRRWARPWPSGGVPTFSLSPESLRSGRADPAAASAPLTPGGARASCGAGSCPIRGSRLHGSPATHRGRRARGLGRPRMPVRRGHGVRAGTAGRCRGRSSRAASRPSRRPPVTRTPPSRPSGQAVPSRCGSGAPEGADDLTEALAGRRARPHDRPRL